MKNSINDIVVKAISDSEEMAFSSVRLLSEEFMRRYHLNNLYAMENKIMNVIILGETLAGYKIIYV